MRFIAITILLLSIASECFSETVICKIDGGFASPKAIAFNTTSNEATFTDSIGKEFHGKIHMSRDRILKQENIGRKYNIFFKNVYGSDLVEFFVFPSSKSTHRVMIAEYKVINGEKYLDIFQGNFEAQCVEINN